MRELIYVVMIVSAIGCTKKAYLQSEVVQLSKPVISVSDFFFERTATMTISHPEEGARIYYVYNDVATAEYEGPKEFRHSFRIDATAIGEDYLASESSSIEAVKLPPQPILSVASDRLPNEKYNAGGLDVLIDRKKGAKDFNNGWLGYSGDTILYKLTIDERKVYMVKVSVLRDQKSWIFSPQKVEVYHHGKLLATEKIAYATDEQDDGIVIVTIPLEHIEISDLEVKVISHKSIPDWHPGAGNKPWTFVDEILIY